MKAEVGDIVHLTGRVVTVGWNRIEITVDGYNGKPLGIALKDVEFAVVDEAPRAEAAE